MLDTVTEAVGEGTDTVEASVSYALGANVERLTLTGAAAINGLGNTLANNAWEMQGANRLDGGTETDTMGGGAGDDTYVVDNVGDVTELIKGDSVDTVETRLALRSTPTSKPRAFTGTAAINGTGNALRPTCFRSALRGQRARRWRFSVDPR